VEILIVDLNLMFGMVARILISRAIGVILFTMATGTIPFGNKQEVVEGIYKVPKTIVLSDQCVELIEAIFCQDVEKRITVEGILSHRYNFDLLKLQFSWLREQAKQV
jgi:serine/threonine protein kinase